VTIHFCLHENKAARHYLGRDAKARFAKGKLKRRWLLSRRLRHGDRCQHPKACRPDSSQN